MFDDPITFTCIVGIALTLPITYLGLKLISTRHELATLTALYQASSSERRDYAAGHGHLRNRIEQLEQGIGDAELRAMLEPDRGRPLLDRFAELLRLFDHLDRRVGQHDKAAVCFWRTASGDVLRLRDMSDGHLLNIQAGGFGTVRFRQVVTEELRRRQEDRDMTAAGERARKQPPAHARELLRKLVRPKPDDEDLIVFGPEDDPHFDGDIDEQTFKGECAHRFDNNEETL